MQRQITLSLILCVAVTLLGCSSGSKVAIDGQFHGVADKMIFLEEHSPLGNKIIDSTRTSTEGVFSFRFMPKTDDPTFYNVICENSFVPLLVSSGEQITISAVGNIFNNYIVQGSAGSQKMREFGTLVVRQSGTMDSLALLYEHATDSGDTTLSKDYGRQYGRQFTQLKRSVISFVISNANSLVSIVPLYLPLPRLKYIFDDPTDIVYYRVVADSLAPKYPNSPYVISLLADLKKVEEAYAMDSLVSVGVSAERVVLPELSMKDAAGKVRSLNDTRGKVVLLDFTSYSTPEFKVLNKELISTYDKYKNSGFEIYQVCVDKNKAEWLKSIIDARLPWITVNDFQGAQSSAISMFNIQKVPTRILIDRQGNIIGRNLYDNKLEEAIQAEL